MNTTFEKYLDTIDKCLKPLPTSERVDIVKEIKGSILEMESENLSTEQILTRLGKPKDLAKAYLGDLLAKENGFSWNRFLTVCAFYSLVGFSGLFVIPVLVIVAPTFILCGVASAVLGIIKLVDYLLHLNIPYNIVDAYNKTEVERAKKEHRKAELLPKFSAHVMRHTACTRMAECRMDVKVLQYIMGHAHIDVTMEVYNHIGELTRIENEIARLDSMVLNA